LAGDRVAPADDRHLDRGHLVERQRPGLVGVDRARRAERLDRAGPVPESAGRRPTPPIWTALIWLSVSVPVLSELIALVEPSVSTERSRFTIAPAAARVCVPMEGTAVTTGGSPGG